MKLLLKDVLVMLVVHKQRWWQLYALNFFFLPLLSMKSFIPGMTKKSEKNFPLFSEKLFRHENYPWINFVLFTHNSQIFPHNPHENLSKLWFFTNFPRPCSIRVDKNVSQAIQERAKEKKVWHSKKFSFSI